MPTKPNKRGRDRESTLFYQNNESNDDTKSLKQNGVTDK